jgi:hypothetical protein
LNNGGLRNRKGRNILKGREFVCILDVIIEN